MPNKKRDRLRFPSNRSYRHICDGTEACSGSFILLLVLKHALWQGMKNWGVKHNTCKENCVMHTLFSGTPNCLPATGKVQFFWNSIVTYFWPALITSKHNILWNGPQIYVSAGLWPIAPCNQQVKLKLWAVTDHTSMVLFYWTVLGI